MKVSAVRQPWSIEDLNMKLAEFASQAEPILKQHVALRDELNLSVSYNQGECVKPDNIRVLAIRQPWASLIMWGGKTFEIRTMNSNIRESIAVYASRSSPLKRDLNWLEEYYQIELDDIFFENLKGDMDPFIKGAILGTVSLVGCHEISKYWFDGHIESHMNNPDWYRSGLFAWELKDPVPVIPIDFKFAPGQVVWSSTDEVIA